MRGRAEPVDITSPGWQAQLPASVAEAFDQDLARLADNEHLARTLLAALAWAKGPGLPWENIWARVARALAEHNARPPSRVPYLITDDDVRWLLDQAGAYVVEDLGPGQRSVYRPFHDLLAAHLRGAPSLGPADADPAQADAWQHRRTRTEKAITDALLNTMPPAGQTRDWGSAHPYLRTYLAQHAAAAGPETLLVLARDPGFLAVADPVTLTPLLSVTVPELLDLARAYRRARPLLGDDPRANAAYLNEAVRALTGTAAPTGTGIRPLYRTQLASVRRDDSPLTLTGHEDAVLSVAFGTGPDGRLLLASGNDDETVRVWDPATGAPAGEPLTGHTAAVTSVAFGAGPDGRLLLASGSKDMTVRLWDPATGAPAGEPLTGHTAAVTSVAFGAGPDGRLLLASGSKDMTVRLWDPATGAPAGEPLTGHTAAVTSVAFGAGPDGRLLLASGSKDMTVRLWDPATGAPAGEPLTGHTAAVTSVAFGAGPDGRLLLASGSKDMTVRLWDPATGARVGKLHASRLTGRTARVLLGREDTRRSSPDIAARVANWAAQTMYNPGAGARVAKLLTGHTSAVTSVAFGAGPDGRLLLASGSIDQTVRLWDPATGAPAGEPLTGHTAAVTSVAFGAGPDGRLLLASGSIDETVRLWDPATGTRAGKPLTCHTSAVTSVAFGAGPDGRLLLASGSDDKTMRLWDPATGTRAGKPLTGYTSAVTSVTLGAGSDGRLLLASCSGENLVRLQDPVAGAGMGKQMYGAYLGAASGLPGDVVGRLSNQIYRAYLAGKPLTGHTATVTSVAFGAGPDGRLLLASGSKDKTVRLWDPIAGAGVGKPVTGQVGGLVGEVLLSPGTADRFTAWVAKKAFGPGADAREGEPLTGHTAAVTSVAFGAGPDGRLLLASGSIDETVRLWDPATGAPAGEPLTGHTAAVTSVAFGAGPDGQLLLASGSIDETVRVWDPATGAPAGEPLTGHTAAVTSVAFGAGPDGQLLLASGSKDKTVRLWDPAAGFCIATIHRRSGVHSVAMTGVVLAIGDHEGVSVIELDW